ncbi:MAG: RnfABCDGE type electron transport complex subunit D [bacterium]
MQTQQPKLLLSTSPFLKPHEDTKFIMWQVNYALAPVVLAAVYFFGISAILIIVACVAGALLPEWLNSRFKRSPFNPLSDGSALITGLLLALTLPPGLPLWIAFIGGISAIALGKLLFGGIGYNAFNPALVGRAFLQAAFPQAMTTWAPHSDLQGFWVLKGDLFALPFAQKSADAVTAATPLAQMKFDSVFANIPDLLRGSTAGSLGETCSLIILLAGVYLAMRGVLNWRIPASILATVFVLAAILYWINPSEQPQPFFHLFSGGLMLGALFMATDPVTSPITQRGCIVFGIGIGILVMTIRLYGGLPEGVMYSILFMNAMTPIIDRVTQPRIYGMTKEVK